MKSSKWVLSAVVLSLSLVTGCTIVGVTDGDYEDTGYYEEVYYEDNYDVDAYVPIPLAVRKLIAASVDGYSMPPVFRYGTTLYPVELYDQTNLPSYVKDDFNGDRISDYAFMFSKVYWRGSEWHLTTKMLVVTSTQQGYALSVDLSLGEVVGESYQPVEEYWGIRYLEPGRHSVTWDNGVQVITDEIRLTYAGIYLTSVDPLERSVWYAEGNDVYETMMDMGVVAKKKSTTNDERANRVIRIADKTLVKLN